MAENTQKTSFADEGRFFILGEFDQQLQEGIVLPLTKKISEESKKREPAPIEVYINSNGGDASVLWHLVSLVELARAKEITVKTIVIGRAYSAGSMLAVAGTPGHRYIDERAEHLPHYGTTAGWNKHTPLQLEREGEFLKRHFSRILQHYHEYCEIPQLEHHIKDDNFFVPANLAIKWKMADKYMEQM